MNRTGVINDRILKIILKVRKILRRYTEIISDVKLNSLPVWISFTHSINIYCVALGYSRKDYRQYSILMKFTFCGREKICRQIAL